MGGVGITVVHHYAVLSIHQQFVADPGSCADQRDSGGHCLDVDLAPRLDPWCDRKVHEYVERAVESTYVLFVFDDLIVAFRNGVKQSLHYFTVRPDGSNENEESVGVGVDIVGEGFDSVLNALPPDESRDHANDESSGTQAMARSDFSDSFMGDIAEALNVEPKFKYPDFGWVNSFARNEAVSDVVACGDDRGR